ncbi:hypothetical protein H0H87_010091 [Tephrocybe sp. NHM501043]|nr:hypothetical protein H0H87_010091 [Tephrocybe sp. NHM501043]
MNPQWSAEFLARSQQSHLTIVAESKHVSTPIFDTILESIHRVRVFSLTGYSASWNHVTERLSNAAPHLQKLALTSTGGAVVKIFTSDIFARYAPCLRELELTGCIFAWTSPFLSNLTSLHVYNIPWDARPSISQVIEGLGNAPLLESLILSAVFPSAAKDDSDGSLPKHPIRLGHLEHLVVQGSVANCTLLLQHITYPIGAKVNIRCRRPHEPIPRLATSYGLNYIHDLGRSLNKDQTYRFIHVGTDGDLVELRAWDALDTTLREPIGEPRLDILFSLRRILQSHRANSVEAMKEFWLGLPLNHLVSFRLEYDCQPLSEEVWSSLAHITTLRHLSVADHGKGVLAALRSVPTSEETISPFPHLCSLGIEGWKFSEKPAPAYTSFGALMDCLKARRQAGHGIMNLHVHNSSGIAATDVEELRSLADNVTWDAFADSDDEDEGEDSDNDEEGRNKDDDEGQMNDDDEEEEEPNATDSDDEYEQPLYFDYPDVFGWS